MRRVLVALTAAAIAASVPASAMANQWDNQNRPGVVMDNVLDPTNRLYDGWGSWYDNGAGLQFHHRDVSLPAGQYHATNPDGHGYIGPAQSILYQYNNAFTSNAPAGALGVINAAFAEWESAIQGSDGVRHPLGSLGFDWGQALQGQPFQIEIDWQPFGGTSAAWVSPISPTQQYGDYYTAYQVRLTFVDQYWDGKAWVDSNFWLDMGSEEAEPGAHGTWSHPFDLFSTALHELGHVAGLDDLYNLYGDYPGGYSPKGFPSSTMGTWCRFGKDISGGCIADDQDILNRTNPYKRYIDLGSLQGVLDLYTVVPEPHTLVLLGLALLLFAAVRSRVVRPRHGRQPTSQGHAGQSVRKLT